MDNYMNGYDLTNTGSATFYGLRNKDSALFNLELPPLYPWAPELPKRPRSTQRQSSNHSTASFNGLSTGSSTSSELPADSEFIPTSSLTGPAKHPDTVLPQKYLTGVRDEHVTKPRRVSPQRSSSNSSTPHASPTHNAKVPTTSTSSHGYGVQTPRKLQLTPKKRHREVGVQTDKISSGSDHKRVPMLTLCKEMVTMTIDRIRRQDERSDHQEETLVDRILASCESVKVAVINILEAYTQSQDSGDAGAVFADSDLVRVTSMQLVASLELLVSQTTIWTAMFDEIEPSQVGEITHCVHDSVRELAMEILAFIQGCEDNTDDEANHSTRILELLYQLVKHCGRLALATDTCPSLSLQDTGADSRMDDLMSLTSFTSSKDDDLVHAEPSSDLKQAFLCGADSFVDQSLDSTVHMVESCEIAAERLTPDDMGAGIAEASSEVLKHVYIAVATSKLLVLKSQQIQVEIDGEMKEDCDHPENYYLRYFKRCQGLLAHINRLSDSVSLLVQAAQPLSIEDDLDPGSLMKVCRCSEMIQRNSRKLVTISCHTGYDDHAPGSRPNLDYSISQSNVSTLSLDLTSLRSYGSDSSTILSSRQSNQMESSGNDVALATNALIELCRRELAPFAGQEIKKKRMLPVTPSSVRTTARCRSARSADRRRLGRNLAELDISRDVQD